MTVVVTVVIEWSVAEVASVIRSRAELQRRLNVEGNRCGDAKWRRGGFRGIPWDEDG